MLQRVHDLSSEARQLLKTARSIADAAEDISSGHSPFGRWLIPGLIPADGLSVLYGPTGSGKSFFTVHVGLCVAGARQWGEHAIEPGTVVYLAAEDRFGIEARAVAAARHLHLNVGELPFEFLTPDCIHDTGWQTHLVDVLRAIAGRNGCLIKLIILDTLSAVFGGYDQNDAGPMSRATERLLFVARSLGCAVLVTHHSGKEADRGHRGSQVLKDRADAFLSISRAAQGLITVNAEKMRNGPADSSASFRLEPFEISAGDRIERTLIVSELTTGKLTVAPRSDAALQASSRPGRPPKDARACLDALRKALDGTEGSITTEAWREAVYASPAFEDRRQGARRQAFNHSKKHLLTAGKIEIEGDSVRLA
jgi:hypothetical protein